MHEKQHKKLCCKDQSYTVLPQTGIQQDSPPGGPSVKVKIQVTVWQ